MGNLELLKARAPYLAVVGTRRCTDYGKKAVIDFTKTLTSAGFIIVSGLAKGIDTLAHKTCIEHKGKTIAVLGSGLDKIYPKENKKLAQEIIQNKGLIISEYPPSTSPNRFHFPERNRIIAGFSLGVLVIEAREKSGALITADWATSQQKPIFAIPGSVYNKTSSGCHFLIKKGAHLVDKPEDILKFFGIKTQKKEKVKGETKEENLILNLLRNNTLHIDQIIRTTKKYSLCTTGHHRRQEMAKENTIDSAEDLVAEVDSGARNPTGKLQYLIPAICLICPILPLAPELAIMKTELKGSKAFCKLAVNLSVASVHIFTTLS